MTSMRDEEFERALDSLAVTEGVTRKEIIRRAVLDRHARVMHRSEVEASARRMSAEWGDVLDRLGSV